MSGIIEKIRGRVRSPRSIAFDAEVERETWIEGDASPEASEWRGFADRVGLFVGPGRSDEPPFEYARRLYEAAEREMNHKARDLDRCITLRAEKGAAGPPESRIRRLEEQLDDLEAFTDLLHGRLNPPALNGDHDETADLRCRICGHVAFRTTNERFEKVGRCDPCRRPPPQEAQPPWLSQLLDQLP